MKKIENPFTYAGDPELRSIFDQMLNLKTRVESKLQEANKIAGIDSPFKKYPEVKLPPAPDYRSTRSNTWARQPISVADSMVADYLANCHSILDAAEVVEKEIYENNLQVKQQVVTLMTRLGIPATSTVYEYPTARSKIKKSFNKTAGYMSDLNAFFSGSSVSAHRSSLTNFKNEFERWRSAQIAEEEKIRIERDEKSVAQVVDNPEFVADMLKCEVNPLAVLKSALPGKKRETILYCVSLARKYATDHNDQPLIDAIGKWEVYFSR